MAAPPAAPARRAAAGGDRGQGQGGQVDAAQRAGRGTGRADRCRRVHPRGHLVPRRRHSAHRAAPARRQPASAAGAPARRRADDRPRRDARRAVRAAGGRLARAEPAVDHADRHPGHRLDVEGGLAAHGRLPRSRRRHAYRGRRRRLPHAARARARRRVPRGVPRSWGGPRDGRQRGRGAVARRRDRRRAGGRDVLGPEHRRPLPGRPDGARALPERGRRGRAARADGPHPAAGRAHGAHRAGPHDARRPGDRAALRRPVPAGRSGRAT